MQPALTTERLILRPRGLADTEACLAMDREPEVTRYISGPWGDPVAHRAFIEARTIGPYPDGLGYWTIAPRDEPDAFAGWVLLIPLDAVGPEIEIGWRLRPAVWGLGYASEAAGAVLRYGFETVDLDEIVAEIDPANLASIRLAERIGMRRDKTRFSEGRDWVRYTGRSSQSALEAQNRCARTLSPSGTSSVPAVT
jgi:RimJ/RimL family protein N-acetyltransferase